MCIMPKHLDNNMINKGYISALCMIQGSVIIILSGLINIHPYSGTSLIIWPYAHIN